MIEDLNETDGHKMHTSVKNIERRTSYLKRGIVRKSILKKSEPILDKSLSAAKSSKEDFFVSKKIEADKMESDSVDNKSKT